MDLFAMAAFALIAMYPLVFVSPRPARIAVGARRH